MKTLTDRFGQNVDSQIADYLDLGLLVACLFYWLGVLIYAWLTPMSREQYGVLFLGGSVVIYMWFEAIDSLRGDWKYKWLDVAVLFVLSVGTLYVTYYVGVAEFDALYYTRIGYQTDMDYNVAWIFVLTITYLTYRSFGIPFLAVLLFAFFYGYQGTLFPGVFHHTGLSVDRLLQRTVLDIDGFYGNINRLMATWIAIFLLYSGLMQGYGAFDLILRGAVRTARYVKSGVAQSAVIGSMVIGSINGSAAANTAISGSVTIPLMKESGMRARSAGATEAVASSGGQIMPPIMGAAAFLMASLLNVPFVDILVAGLVPAIIFYTSVVFAVHFTARQELQDLDPSDLVDEKKSRNEILYQTTRFLIPFLLLIYFLGILQYTIMTSALYTVIAMLTTGIVFPLVKDLTKEGVLSSLGSTAEGFKYGAKAAVPIAIVIAAINAVVDILQTTGMPSALALAIMDLSGGVMVFAVILTMIICIILGLGMPTVAAYLLVALLVAPTLTGEFGVPSMAAHFFVFYAAILSALTPPIAVGVVVASGIADSDFWRTCDKALRISAPLFVLPFMFVYHPEVITPSIGLVTITSAAIGLAGAISIVYALNNPLPDLPWSVAKGMKVVYFFAGLGAMVLPSNAGRLGCLALIGAVFVAQTVHISGVPAPVQRIIP